MLEVVVLSNKNAVMYTVILVVACCARSSAYPVKSGVVSISTFVFRDRILELNSEMDTP